MFHLEGSGTIRVSPHQRNCGLILIGANLRLQLKIRTMQEITYILRSRSGSYTSWSVGYGNECSRQVASSILASVQQTSARFGREKVIAFVFSERIMCGFLLVSPKGSFPNRSWMRSLSPLPSPPGSCWRLAGRYRLVFHAGSCFLSPFKENEIELQASFLLTEENAAFMC